MKTFAASLALIFALSFIAGCESEPEDATSIATPIDRPVVVQDVSPEPNLAPTQIMTASH
ncbi:MAG: hypothetical protein ACI87E_003854, partial [Mariniblastus sp.]